MEAAESVKFTCDANSDEGISGMDSRSAYSVVGSSQYSSSSEDYSTPPCSPGDVSEDTNDYTDGDGVVDSLTMALQELRCQQQASNFFEAHRRIGDSSKKSSYEYLEQQRNDYKRSSSLKSKKTPPGTPNQLKKAVRFADAFGLDLAYVKHVFDLDMPPVIPPEATFDLDLRESDEGCDVGSERAIPRKVAEFFKKSIISPRFAQPGDSSSFVGRVVAQKVLLERASVADDDSVDGIVRVANLDFKKDIRIHWTFNDWKDSHEEVASHVHSDGVTDKFCFKLPAAFDVADKLAFCVRYAVAGEVFWDNNFGENYCFDCYTVNASCH